MPKMMHTGGPGKSYDLRMSMIGPALIIYECIQFFSCSLVCNGF